MVLAKPCSYFTSIGVPSSGISVTSLKFSRSQLVREKKAIAQKQIVIRCTMIVFTYLLGCKTENVATVMTFF